MARKKGGIGAGALRMGGGGRKPPMPRTPMATAPIGPPGGMASAGSDMTGPGPSPMGIKRGGSVTKHARGGEVGREREERREARAEGESERQEKREQKMGYAKGGEVGGETKARVRAGRDNC